MDFYFNKDIFSESVYHIYYLKIYVGRVTVFDGAYRLRIPSKRLTGKFYCQNKMLEFIKLQKLK